MPPANIDLAAVAKHINGLSNKDKVIKIVQYGAQALQHYVLTDSKDPVAQRVNTLFWSLVLHRKLFRYFNSLSDLVSIRKRLQELSSEDPKVDKISSALLLGKNTSFFFFWFLDNAVYLSMGKVAKFNAAPVALASYHLWTLANIFSLARNLRLYGQCEEWQVEKKQDLKLSILKDFADLVTSVGFSKALNPHISWGQIGIAGIVSAVLHLYLTWPRIHSVKPRGYIKKS
mmetsp:Transcript_9608/g.23644  ORF Transcript_9608/g.23644 Transcript_9608/m.23644 type:complete len:230 (+) Transcript_9608:56-745(+)